MTKKFLTLIAISFTLQASAAQAFDFGFSKPEKRSYIRVTGSSTISPFMAAIAEEFARAQNSKNIPTKVPVIESTGSKIGFDLFCDGVGEKYPDFTDASRPIHKDELEKCHKNGVKEIVEIKIGYDGITIGNAVGNKKMNLTKAQIFMALAEKVADEKSKKLIKNPYRTWNEIDPSLPNARIMIYGPPLTSGTRDVFNDVVMEEICMPKAEFIDAYKDHDERRMQCHKIRKDGVFIESGENDNVLVQNLKKHPDALGILGFNFFVTNRDIIQAISIDNVEPSFDSISSKKYELSRPLFVYFKKEHLNLVPGINDFLREIVNSETIGPKGYLRHGGLITLNHSELKKSQATIAEIR